MARGSLDQISASVIESVFARADSNGGPFAPEAKGFTATC